MNLQNKFQCYYKLTLQWNDNGQDYISVVTNPVSIQFQVSKALFQSTNTATITIYNLDGSTRESIYQDRLIFETNKRKMLTLEAGYGETLTMVCLGYIQQCYSERVGTDFVTTIEVLDPDILSEYTSVTFEAGTSFEEAYKYLASQLPSLQIGELGQLKGEFKTPVVFDGNAFVAINKLTGGHTFIDNGVINTLNDNETLSNYDAYLIASETGLLGTPKRYDAVLEINMLFEPTIRIGQMVEIQSETQSRFNGQYKVLGYTHQCTISEAECGTRTTSLQLQYVNYLTDSNINLTSNPQGAAPSMVVNNDVKPINSKVTSDIKSVYDYIKTNNGAIPNKSINKLITWKDMLGHNNTSDERNAEITLAKLANCKAIADRVQDFVNVYFAGSKITVNSGWRSTANNKREGGVSNSQHLTGRAIDFKISGYSAKTVANAALKSKMFSYRQEYSSWVHVDIRKA